jgi:4'-phosphopantetheinyl transferase
MNAIRIHHRVIDLSSNFGSRICWARISELQTCELDCLLLLFPPSVRARILRLHRETDRNASALSKWLLACCLGETADPARIFAALRYTDSGRPFLDHPFCADLSVSHSGDIAVCAISHHRRVGIDIEHKRSLDINDFQDVFHPEVWDAILRSPAKCDSFFEHWTILEAVAKGEGRGFGGPVQSMRTETSTVEYQGTSWRLYPLPLDPEYTAHLAIS